MDSFRCRFLHMERGGGGGTFLHGLEHYLSENQHLSLTFSFWPQLVLSGTEMKSRTPICRDPRRKYLV